MDQRKIIRIVATGWTLYFGARLFVDAKNLIQEWRANHQNEANKEATEVVLANLYAMRVVLMANCDGRYEDEVDPEKLRNDFELAKMEYFIKRGM